MSESNLPDSSPNYTGRELPYKALYWAMASVVIVGVVFAVLLIPIVRGLVVFDDEREAGDMPYPDARPSGPLLQPKPEIQMEDYLRRENEVLESYGWRDESAGIARIPIDRAIDLVLEQGIAPTAPAVASQEASE